MPVKAEVNLTTTSLGSAKPPQSCSVRTRTGDTFLAATRGHHSCVSWSEAQVGFLSVLMALGHSLALPSNSKSGPAAPASLPEPALPGGRRLRGPAGSSRVLRGRPGSAEPAEPPG